MDHAEYLKRVRSYIKVPTKEMEEQLEGFCGLCTYISGQYDQDDSFITLNKHLEELEQGRKEQNRVFYMALPPSVFITVSEHLKKNCYPKNGIARIIVRSGFPGIEDRGEGGSTLLIVGQIVGRETVRKRSRKLARTSEGPRA